MTRILHVTECYAGGVRRVIDTIAATTPEHEHHLLWADPEGDDRDVSTAFASTTQLPPGFLRRVESVRTVAGAHKADLVHAHSSWAGVYCRARRLEMPVIYQPHCYKFDDPTSPVAARLIYREAEKLMARRTDTTVVLSDHERDLAKGLGARSNVLLVPNTSSMNPPVRPIDRSIPAPDEQVIMIGRISTQKDPDYFAQVAKRVRDVRPQTDFRWIGSGPDGAVQKLEASGIGVSGWLDRTNLSDLLSGHVTYLHTAQYEGFPVSILDAAAFGVPILAREIPAFADTGLPKCGTTEDAAEKLLNILTPGNARGEAIHASEQLSLRMSSSRQLAALQSLYSPHSAR